MPQDRNEEFKMIAYRLNAFKSGDSTSIPNTLVDLIKNVDLTKRWTVTNPSAGDHSQTIKNLDQFPSVDAGGRAIYKGKIVNLKFLEAFNLGGFDGAEETIHIPPDKGESTEALFVVAPAKNLVIIQSVRRFEKKFEDVLNTVNSREALIPGIDQFKAEAIPTEDDPVGFLRQNPNLGTFKARISATEFEQGDYGALKTLFRGLGEESDSLYLEVTVSSGKRGEALPSILASHLADFMTNIEEENLQTAAVREYSGRKQFRPTKILNAIQTKSVLLHGSDENRFSAMLDYILSLIVDLED